MTSLPARLKFARKQAGLGALDVEHQAPVSPEALLAWEHGTAEPTLAELHALARLYGRSAAWLLEDGPIRSADHQMVLSCEPTQRLHVKASVTVRHG